ncbi:MAG: ribosome small subunit-dependent GTPase A [Lachnospiraceae bacterium]|nr:ribosome small subunit-dependent GTPase A [Lachnospiraceae bacterium]
MQGKIIKGIAGFYYVHIPGKGVYECKAKGIFRKDKKKPLVGDNVEIQVLMEEEKKGNIEALLPRRSELIRPAVVNIDQALVIFSIVKPQPNFNLLDRFLIMMEQQGIPCIICFNKADIDEELDGDTYEAVYRSCGYETMKVSAKNGLGVEQVKKLLHNKTTTVAGPSGVGKSSLINELQSGIRMETGDISAKIERGKHTTRHSELIAIEDNTYILDTPGFSSLGLFDMEKEELAGFYPEFAKHECYCKFGGCAHINEPVCGIKDAVANGEISTLRYENYKLLYEELKGQKKY